MANSLAWINAPWTPLSEPSILGWWKSDTLALNDGDPISSWTDSGLYGYTMTGTGVNRPTYKVNIQNGLPAALFSSATNQWLSSNMDATTKPFTLAVVTMSTTFSTITGSLLGSNSDGGMALQNVLTDWRLLSDGVITIANAGYTLVNSTWYIIVVTYDGVGNWAMLNNGVGVSGTLNKAFTGGGRSSMGRRNGGVFWNGYIGEVIKFSAVVGRAQVDSYLNSKWAVH